MKPTSFGTFSRNWPAFLLILGVGALLSSCATLGRDFQVQDADRLTIGQTTMAEARETLGSPVKEIDTKTLTEKRVHFGDEKIVTTWVYLYASGSALGANAKTLEVDFDKTGRVEDYFYTSTYGKDGIPKLEDKNLRNFDFLEAKDKIIRQRTTKDELVKMFGQPEREMKVSKPGAENRWLYFYREKSKTDKVTVSSGIIDRSYNVTYKKRIVVDMNEEGVVQDVRGETDFPSDKDRYFTK